MDADFSPAPPIHSFTKKKKPFFLFLLAPHVFHLKRPWDEPHSTKLVRFWHILCDVGWERWGKSGEGGVVEWAIQRGRIETREVHRQWIAYGFDLGGYGNCRIGMKLELIAGLWQWRMKYTAFWMRYLRTNRVEWTDWRAGGLAGWWAAVGRTIGGGDF